MWDGDGRQPGPFPGYQTREQARQAAAADVFERVASDRVEYKTQICSNPDGSHTLGREQRIHPLGAPHSVVY